MFRVLCIAAWPNCQGMNRRTLHLTQLGSGPSPWTGTPRGKAERLSLLICCLPGGSIRHVEGCVVAVAIADEVSVIAAHLTNFIHSLCPSLSLLFCRSFIPLVSLFSVCSLCSSILYNAIVVNCGPAGHLHHGCSGQYGGSGQGFAAMCCTLGSYIEQSGLTSVSWNASLTQSLRLRALQQTRPVSVQTRASLQMLRHASWVLAPFARL